MIIDCHAHLVPPPLLEAVRAKAQQFPSLRLVDQGAGFGFSFAGGKPTRPVSKPLSDIPARLKWMDENKIDRQVVGGWLDMFGNELPAEEGTRWAELINAHLLEAAQKNPGSFRLRPCRFKMGREPARSFATHMPPASKEQ